MKKIIVILVALLPTVFCTTMLAQTAPDTLWVKKYGSSGMDVATAILQNSDGGFTILGFTTTRGAGGQDVMLIRTNALGDTLWTRTYGGTGYEDPRDFAATTDGGFIIVAISTSMNDGHTYPYCLRVNAQGDTSWTRFLTTTQDGDYFSICRTGDSYMILGNANNDVFLQKIDVSGNTIWSRFLGIGGNGRQLRATTDGGFVANGNSGGSMVSMKIDSIGTVLWYRAFRGGQSIGAAATSDGGIVSTGDGYGYFTGDRYDAAGNHLWSRTYGAYYNNGYCVVQAYDGSSVLGGYCNPNAEWSGVPCLYKTDTSGNVSWSDPFPYLYRGIIYRGIVTWDHGYAFIGWTSVDGNVQPYLLKLASDPSNVIPCPPTSLPFVDNFDSPTLDSCWSWIREDTSHWSLSARPGWMRIWTQYGSIYDGTDKNLLLRNPPASSYQLETRVAIAPQGSYEAAAILLYNGANDFLSLYRQAGGIQNVGFQGVHNGSLSVNTYVPCSDTLLYLRMEVFNNMVIGYWSADSVNWIEVGQVANTWASSPNLKVGPAANTWGTAEIPVDFDYFRVTALDTTRRSLLLGGSGGYVDCGTADSVKFSSTFTIDLFARFLASTGLPQALVARDIGGGNNPKWILFFDETTYRNRISFHINGQSASWSTSNLWIPTFGQWYHVAVVLENHLCTFYIDGQSIGSAPLLGDVPNVPAHLLIGQAEGGNFFNGELDNVRIWNRALSQVQIQSIRGCNLDNAPGLLAGYHFDQQTGSTIYDSGPFGYNGTLVGNATTWPSNAPQTADCRYLWVTPGALNYGTQDLGATSMQRIALYNPSSLPIPIVSLIHQSSAFTLDTSGLNGAISPNSTFLLGVTFDPAGVGSYKDTLAIVAQQATVSVFRIPFTGEAQIILPPVDSLVIVKGSLNGVQLHWSPVLHTITGQPVPPTVGYIIYGAETPDGPWFPFGYSTTTSYLHPYVLRYRRVLFYSVTADPTVAETFKAKAAMLPEFLLNR